MPSIDPSPSRHQLSDQSSDADESTQRRRRAWALTIARVHGIPIRLHLTFVILVAYLAWATTSRASSLVSWIELTVLGMIFASVVLHELGHAYLAHRFGVPTTSITLYPFGGLARLARRPPSTRAELCIAAAGPAVNLILAGLILLLTGARVLDPGHGLSMRLLSILLWSNLAMAGINLVPAFPLDGGRMLRSHLADSIGWIRATIWCASIGQVLAVVLIIVGIRYSPWWLLAGLVILPGANVELRRAHLLRSLLAEQVRDVMARHIAEVSPETPLADLAELSRDRPLLELVVVDSGEAVGFLPSARLWAYLAQADEGRGEDQGLTRLPVTHLMVPLGPPLSETSGVQEALDEVEQAAAEAAPVLTAGGDLVGVITRATLQRASQRIEAARLESEGSDHRPSSSSQRRSEPA